MDSSETYFLHSFVILSLGLFSLNIRTKRCLIAAYNSSTIGNHLITNIQGNPKRLNVFFSEEEKNHQIVFYTQNKGER